MKSIIHLHKIFSKKWLKESYFRMTYFLVNTLINILAPSSLFVLRLIDLFQALVPMINLRQQDGVIQTEVYPRTRNSGAEITKKKT